MSSDCESYEVRTVLVDSIGQSNHNDFTNYLNIPLRNIVSAEVLNVSVPYSLSSGASSNVVYLYCEQLVSKFNERALPGLSENLGGNSANTVSPISVSNVAFMSGAILRFNTEQTPGLVRTIFSLGANFPSEVHYIEPIRQLAKLHLQFFHQDGSLLNMTQPVFVTFRFKTARNNICNY